MPNYAEYFDKVCYKPKWFIGDRVSGKYKKIPFIGTVGNDTLVSELEGPRVSVFLDLPMKVDNTIKTLIIVKPNELKRLISMDETGPLKPKEEGSIPSRRTKQKNTENETTSKERNEKRKTKQKGSAEDRN